MIKMANLIIAFTVFIVPALSLGMFNPVKVFSVKSSDNFKPGSGRIDGAGLIAFNPDGTRFAVVTNCGEDKECIKVFDTSNGALLFNLQHDDLVNFISFDSDGAFIVSSSANNKAIVWDTSEGKVKFELMHDDSVNSAVFSSDGKMIITASKDKTAKLWTAKDGKLLRTLEHEEPVSFAIISSDSSRLITTAWNDLTRIYYCNEFEDKYLESQGFTYDDEELNKKNIILSSDGDNILTFRVDRHEGTMGIAQVNNMVDGSLKFMLKADESWSNYDHVLFSRNGKRIIGSSSKKNCECDDEEDGSFSGDLEEIEERGLTEFFKQFLPKQHNKCAFSLDIFDTNDGKLLWTKNHNAQINSIDVGSGKYIATASENGSVGIFNHKNGELLFEIKNLHRVNHVRFSPDGSRVVIISENELEMWVLPPKEFLTKKALLHSEYSLTLGTLKYLLQTYIESLKENEIPSYSGFKIRYPRIELCESVLKDLMHKNKGLGHYIGALLPDLF